MKIMHPLFNEPIELSTEYVRTLVIENQDFFFRFVNDLYEQTEKNNGEIVLSCDNAVVDISKNVELITQFIPFDINNKKIVNRLHSYLKELMSSETMYMRTNEIKSDMFKYILEVLDYADGDLICDDIDDLSAFLKLCNVRFDDSEIELPNKILTYAESVRIYEGNKMFVFVNAGSYISPEKMEILYKEIVGHDIISLFIECKVRSLLPNESRVIIDNDLCII